MKKRMLAAALMVLIMSLSMADAAQTTAETDDPDLTKLRHKIVRMKREMDTFIKDIMETYPDQGKGLLQDAGQDVRVDLNENDKEMIVKADLPGMDKNKIEVSLSNNRTLRISGSRDIAKTETTPGYVRQERMTGSFERTIELPSDGTQEGISASYKNGVLEIVIPKKERDKAGTVKIKVL